MYKRQLHESGKRLRIRDIRVNPVDRTTLLPFRPLMLIHNDETHLLPDDDVSIVPGDRILWTGKQGMRERVAWLLHNPDQLEYAMDGHERPVGIIGRWWLARNARQQASSDH